MKKLLFIAGIFLLTGCVNPNFVKQTNNSKNNSQNSLTTSDCDYDKKWPVENSKNSKVSYTKNKYGEKYYSVEHKSASGSTMSSIPCQFRSGYYMETDAFHISGEINKAYGLVFGASDSKNHYWFYINADRQYGFSKIVDDKIQIIKYWTTSSAIVKEVEADGAPTPNSLEIKNYGSYWEFYVNDKLLFNYDSEPFFGNRIGVRVAGKQTVGWVDLYILKMK